MPNKKTLYVGSADFGEEVLFYAGKTKEKLFANLYEDLKNWWKDDFHEDLKDVPEDHEEAISAYFEKGGSFTYGDIKVDANDLP